MKLPETRERAASDKPAVERRREPRSPCQLSVEILPQVPGAHFVLAEVVDFSPKGLAVLVGCAIETEEQFVVKVRTPQLRLLLYTARNCRRTEAGWRVGAELERVMNCADETEAQEVLATLLAQLLLSAMGQQPGSRTV